MLQISPSLRVVINTIHSPHRTLPQTICVNKYEKNSKIYYLCVTFEFILYQLFGTMK